MTDREAIESIKRLMDPDIYFPHEVEAMERALSALQERAERNKEGKSLREKIERYKIESGFASATPEERAMFAESLIDILESLDIPTIDAVPVVRCEDCKHYALWSNGRAMFYCDRHDHTAYDEDFCSYGERRADHV